MVKYKLKRKGFGDIIGIYDSKAEAAHDLWNKTIALHDEGITPFDFECEEFDAEGVDCILNIADAVSYLKEGTSPYYVFQSNRGYIVALDELLLMLRAWNDIDDFRNGGISLNVYLKDEDRKREFITKFEEQWRKVQFMKV